MRRMTACLLACLLLSGCAYAARQAQAAEEDLYRLYFTVADLEAAAAGDAVEAETISMAELKELDTKRAAEKLMEALLAGPSDPELKSPFPSGVQLLSVRTDGRQVTVDLSAAYGMLSGIGLTLADYCITLTLTQLPDISTVKVTVRGQELAYRTSQTFSELDVLLSSTEDVVSTVQATLYFLNGDGAMEGEARRLELYEGDTQVSALVSALRAGPESRGWSSALPEGFSILSAWLEEDICYVNLASAALNEMEDRTNLQTALDALAESLASLDAVEEVRYLVDGEYAGRYGTVLIGGTYPRAEEAA